MNKKLGEFLEPGNFCSASCSATQNFKQIHNTKSRKGEWSTTKGAQEKVFISVNLLFLFVFLNMLCFGRLVLLIISMNTARFQWFTHDNEPFSLVSLMVTKRFLLILFWWLWKNSKCSSYRGFYVTCAFVGSSIEQVKYLTTSISFQFEQVSPTSAWACIRIWTSKVAIWAEIFLFCKRNTLERCVQVIWAVWISWTWIQFQLSSCFTFFSAWRWILNGLLS